MKRLEYRDVAEAIAKAEKPEEYEYARRLLRAYYLTTTPEPGRGAILLDALKKSV